MADAIDSGDVTAVRNGMAALDGFPCVVLVHADCFFSSDASRWRWDKKESARLARRSAARLPDTIDPSKSIRRFSRNESARRLKPQIAGREIKFFVVQRVVGNMHLAINAKQRTVRVNRCTAL